MNPGTLVNSCRHVLPCANMTLKLSRYFYWLLEISWSLLARSVFLLSDGTMQPENTYSHILKVTGKVWEAKKRLESLSKYGVLLPSGIKGCILVLQQFSPIRCWKDAILDISLDIVHLQHSYSVAILLITVSCFFRVLQIYFERPILHLKMLSPEIYSRVFKVLWNK